MKAEPANRCVTRKARQEKFLQFERLGFRGAGLKKETSDYQ